MREMECKEKQLEEEKEEKKLGMSNVHILPDENLGGVLREYVENNNRLIEPTDIVHIDGQRYRMVDREAKVGERIIIVNGYGWYRDKVGDIYDVIHPSKYNFDGNDISKTYVEHEENVCDDVIHFVRCGNYRVLEPVEPTEIVAPEEGDDKFVLDLLANLARRVTKLERENKELRHQSHNHRLDIEQIYIDVKSLRENVDVLDERTQPLLALIKAVKEESK